MSIIAKDKSASEIIKGDIQVLTISEKQVQQLLDNNALLLGLEDGFRKLSRGEIQTPYRPEITVPQKGFVLSMPAYTKGMQITVKMVSVFEGNLDLDLPSHLAVIVLLDPETGKTNCIMDGTYITAVRTSASAVLSAKILSRKNSKTATILGAGVQGREHLNILPLVRDLDKIYIGSLYYQDAEKLAASNPKAVAIDNFEAAVNESDIVCLASHSYKPIIKTEWLKPGAHVSSVGYAPPDGELPRELAGNHKLFVETRNAFEPPPVGCAELSGLDKDRGVELGEVLTGLRPGRESDAEITVYKAMGIAMEDMVAANLVYSRARSESGGTNIIM